MSQAKVHRPAALVVVFMLLAGCAARQTGPLQPGPAGYPEPGGFNQFSREQEIQIGREAAAEADAQLPLVPTGNPVSEYVSQLGQSLAKQLPAAEEPRFQYNFRVVNAKEVNAFALPGGPIRINVGVLNSADNEAELAGVIAHEISHVYMRHATENASKQMVAQVPAAILGSILGGGVGGQLARLGLSFGLGSVFLKYSRDAESEADRVGAKILYDAGYDPHAMVTFFRKLEEEGGSRGPEFLSSHPDPGNRAENVQEAISQLPPKDYRENSRRFQQAKNEAQGLHPLGAEELAQYQKEHQPSVEQVSMDEIMPDGRYQRLDHSVFSIQYPANWKVYGDRNSPVTIAPPAGVSQDAIAYGVVISGYQPQQRQSLDRSTRDVFQTLQRSNPQMRALGSPRSGSVQGRPARMVDLQGVSPLTAGNQRVAERDLLVTVERSDGSVLWLLFIAPEPHFDRLRPAFERMMNSLQL